MDFSEGTVLGNPTVDCLSRFTGFHSGIICLSLSVELKWLNVLHELIRPSCQLEQ
jgi:hypothetical protein